MRAQKSTRKAPATFEARGGTNQGLLALDNPKAERLHTKNLSRFARRFFVFRRFIVAARRSQDRQQQMHFAVTTPSREKVKLKNPQIFQFYKKIIEIPLNMARANAEAILNRYNLKEKTMLTSKQRAILRGKANTMDPVFIVGKGEIDETMIQGVKDCLDARELIKLKVLESSMYNAREASVKLAEATGADCVQVIGSKFVLYLQKKKDSAYADLLK